MLEKLFNLVKSNSDLFEDEFSSLLTKFGDFDNAFNFKPLFNNVSNFNLDNSGKFYELSFDVDKDADANDVEINLDKNKMLCVSYKKKTKNGEHMVSIKETLPVDSDENSLDAFIKDGKLFVTIDKLALNKPKDVKIPIGK